MKTSTGGQERMEENMEAAQEQTPTELIEVQTAQVEIKNGKEEINN